MLKNNDIICISSIDWDFIWQGHQEIMSVLAANGNRVLFIENTGVRSPGIRDISRLGKRFSNYFRGVKGIRRESENLYVYSPIVLPFPYSRIARWINKQILLSVIKRWMKAVRFSDPIIWTFLPTGTALDIIENINRKLLVYYCIDSFAASSSSAKKIKAYEKKLISSADLVFVTSQALHDYCSQFSSSVSMFPFGVNITSFEEVRNRDTVAPQGMEGINGPVIGYVGGIHKWIDQRLVREAALKHPEHTFVFVGPVQTDVSELSSLANVRFLGGKKHSELPYYVKYFSVCIIPYLMTEYTKNVYPTKLNEYLSMGKPVVSTALPEVIRFNNENGGIVSVGDGTDGFISSIEEALLPGASALTGRRMEAAALNSWNRRIEDMSGLINARMESKTSLNANRWREELVSFYKSARSRFIKIAAAIAVLYVAVFYTPLVWYVAEPLKVSDALGKSDAIVVFAGGVGESGRAGQGSMERLGYAVSLHHEGYAPYLVFSSGYTNVYREADVMKAVAVSLGVPSSRIILDEDASNTYENVESADEIARKMSWRRIMVVSSPYHMRRVVLTFSKSAPGLDVICAPVPQSSFYSHRMIEGLRQTNIRQIKAILHEYLSIVYYWAKGYI